MLLWQSLAPFDALAFLTCASCYRLVLPSLSFDWIHSPHSFQASFLIQNIIQLDPTFFALLSLLWQPSNFGALESVLKLWPLPFFLGDLTLSSPKCPSCSWPFNVITPQLANFQSSNLIFCHKILSRVEPCLSASHPVSWYYRLYLG